jgi:hypothetical protein
LDGAEIFGKSNIFMEILKQERGLDLFFKKGKRRSFSCAASRALRPMRIPIPTFPEHETFHVSLFINGNIFIPKFEKSPWFGVSKFQFPTWM